MCSMGNYGGCDDANPDPFRTGCGNYVFYPYLGLTDNKDLVKTTFDNLLVCRYILWSSSCLCRSKVILTGLSRR